MRLAVGAPRRAADERRLAVAPARVRVGPRGDEQAGAALLARGGGDEERRLAWAALRARLERHPLAREQRAHHRQ